MTRKFERKLLERGSVDTRKYRYICREYSNRTEIQRLSLELLGTVDAWDEWETVKVVG